MKNPYKIYEVVVTARYGDKYSVGIHRDCVGEQLSDRFPSPLHALEAAYNHFAARGEHPVERTLENSGPGRVVYWVTTVPAEDEDLPRIAPARAVNREELAASIARGE